MPFIVKMIFFHSEMLFNWRLLMIVVDWDLKN